ncbi:YibE/F family protein [Streptomyces sp. KMM 9044]|uniref:YibE/F family protein n=1 Tax=Streptomyces sp. KMM 9044 TaxID=2744474 RepID=UPI00215086B6|nr:YibE/F family protein [Streptomyces sp. KMM 9044]WAX79057.1 YibE/F family protein [Streptomyces sp. KMM 9044]
MTSTQPPPYPPPEPPRGSGARLGGDRGRGPAPDHGLSSGDGQEDGPGSGDWFGHGPGEAPAAQSHLPGRGPGHEPRQGRGGQSQGRARGQDHGPGHDHSQDLGGGGRGRGSNSGGGPNSGGGHNGPPPGDGGHQHSPGSDGGHGHSHSHGPAAPVSKHLRKVIAAVLIPFGAAVLIGLTVLWPGGTPGHERTGVGFDRQTQQATVTKVDEVSCSSVNASGGVPTGDTSTAEGSSAQQQADGTCKKATVRVDTGDDAGRTFTEIVQPDQSRQLSEGQEVVVAYEPSAPEDLQYSVADVNRRVPLALLAGIFAVAVVAVGRLRGVMALIALAVSFLVLNFFILPAILQGSNPLAVAVVGASAIMLQALYLCHGLSARTSVAVIGTLISLLLIGILGSVFISWAALTGDTDDNTGLIHGLYPDIDMSGLLLAGVIIGSLGVLDDVTVTQTSAVWELHEANPSMGRRGLYRAGIRIGRDHIASVVNTLVLAYAGAALPLLLLFSIAQSSVGTVANSELVAEEIVRTLIGSIGLVASVPVTTALAALVVSADRSTAQAAGEGIRAAPARGGRGRRRKR